MNTMNPVDDSPCVDYENVSEISKPLSKEELAHFFLFFSPRTVEDHFVHMNTTPEIIQEVQEFMPYFTRTDAYAILDSKDSKECLYRIAHVIGRIRLEQSILRINGVHTFSSQVTAGTMGRFYEILTK
jgi:hypothetical protein